MFLRPALLALLLVASAASRAQQTAAGGNSGAIPDLPDGPLSAQQVRQQLDAYAAVCPASDRATVTRIEVLDAVAIQKLDEGEIATDPNALYLVLHVAGGNRRDFMLFPLGAVTAAELNALVGRPACILAAP